jgi:hypothetical protein
MCTTVAGNLTLPPGTQDPLHAMTLTAVSVTAHLHTSLTGGSCDENGISAPAYRQLALLTYIQGPCQLSLNWRQRALHLSGACACAMTVRRHRSVVQPGLAQSVMNAEVALALLQEQVQVQEQEQVLVPLPQEVQMARHRAMLQARHSGLRWRSRSVGTRHYV